MLVDKDIPIVCSYCGRTMRVESWTVDFEYWKDAVKKGLWISHGYCQECADKLIEDLKYTPNKEEKS